MSRIFYLLLLLVVTSCSAMDRKYVDLTINGKTLRVEVADTQEKRRQGLMNRETLKKDEGMLFIFKHEQKMTFWMKNTTIPLSIAYINKSGVIKEIHDMTPLSEKPVYSSYSVLYALEVNQGYFTKAGIRTGDKIQF